MFGASSVPCGEAGDGASPQCAGRHAEIVEELRTMYPDAPDALVQEAARAGSLDDAFDALTAGLVAMQNGSAEVRTPTQSNPMAHLRALEALLPQYSAEEVRCILAGFGGDGRAACYTAVERPDLIEVIVRKGWSIEQSTLADEEEQCRRMKEEEQAVAEATVKRKAEKLEIISAQKTLFRPPPCTESLREELHRQLFQYASTDGRGVPSCWDGTHGIVSLGPGAEFTAVASYFGAKLGYVPEVRRIARVQNYETFEKFKGNEGNTIMFHGCRTDGNERSIAFGGFQIQVCKSNRGGVLANGSWFAYAANYSDSGFVLSDANGICHIFLCIVSTREVLLNDQVMRVVGQDCAVPLWIVTYTRPTR